MICTHLNIGILLAFLKYLNTDYNGDGRKLEFVTNILHQTPYCSKPRKVIQFIWRKLYFYIVAGYEWSREWGCEVATISLVWSSVWHLHVVPLAIMIRLIIIIIKVIYRRHIIITRLNIKIQESKIYSLWFIFCWVDAFHSRLVST